MGVCRTTGSLLVGTGAIDFAGSGAVHMVPTRPLAACPSCLRPKPPVFGPERAKEDTGAYGFAFA